MKNLVVSPIDIFCRELTRLENDIDRLQMIITLKSHLNHLQLTSNIISKIFSIFNHEQYRLQAVYQLIPFIYQFITTDCLKELLELFNNDEYRLNLIETLKNCELLQTNKEVTEMLLDEYRQYFHIKSSETPINLEADLPITTTSDTEKIVSTPSGVFEKAKQFVCRVFGGSSSINDDLPSKQITSEIDSSAMQSTSLPTSQSYTSILTKSLPPSRQSSMSFHVDTIQSTMVTQIHSILDNIDSVLNKIESQNPPLPQNHDQITQTTFNDGSGDINYDYYDETDSLLSSDQSEQLFDY